MQISRRAVSALLVSLLVSLLASVVVALAGAGCSEHAEAADDGAASANEQPFSVMVKESDSILPDIESSRGRPSVCIALLDFSDDDVPDATRKLEALITATANDWNALLHGDASWPVQGPVAPTFVVQRRLCPSSGPGINVNVWRTPERFRADRCSDPRWTCASSSAPSLHSIYLGPLNRGTREDPFSPFNMLHEYGHLLGLGDTYRIAGKLDFVGEQPPSVMNGRSKSLTFDDRLGLTAVLRTLKTGARSCDGLGTPVEMTENEWEAFMCDPAATPEIDRGPVR